MFSEIPRPKPPAPPKCDCNNPGSPDCGDMSEKQRAENRRLDIEDVTDSVMKVMRICGLKPWEVKLAASVIRRSFTYFEEIVVKIDRVPRKRFGTESFMHGMAHVAHMSRIDAQMAYAIVKRAFKAFYYGTGVEGKRFACLQLKLQHREECMWLHAAHRTAEIYAVLAGLMDSEKRLFEERIECVYKTLVDVLKTRFMWDNDMVCSCGQPSAAASRTNWGKAVSQVDSVYSAEIELLYHKENKALSSAPSKTSAKTPTFNEPSAVSSASSRHNHVLKKVNQTQSNKGTTVEPSAISIDHPQCKCRKLRCWQENGESREAPEITAECSQGPYICRWLPYDGEDDQDPKHYVPYPPMVDVCPPCPTDDLPCDPECTCTCQVCTCQPAFDGDFEEEHLGEKISKTGIEDHDTDFCWVGPFWGSSRERMARQRAREELLKAEDEAEEEGEEEGFQCRCTCDIKQRAFPHLFTYLTDFKDKLPVKEEPQPDPEPESKETESEDLLSKPPPYGISQETYRCWVQRKSSESESGESDVEKKKPPLVWVLADKPKPKPEIQITIKRQHIDSSPAPVNAPLPKAPVLPTKPAPPPAPGKPPLAPQKQEEKDEKLTKEDILDIIGMRFK
ncbi:hypothetical protein KR032_001967, partial [Drosophila birchii]